MKTTIEIPDPLYRRAKIRAVEEGTSLKDLILRGLEGQLSRPQGGVDSATGSYWANRKLLPEYAAALEEGAFSGGTDSSRAISAERDGR